MAVFLDISNAFDKVWHNGFLFKLKNYDISGSLFTIIKAFLANRQQRVVLNEKSSCWSSITAGVPQSAKNIFNDSDPRHSKLNT